MCCLNICKKAPAERFNAHRICILGAPNSSSSCAWHAMPYTVRFLLPFRYLYQNQQHSTLLTQKTGFFFSNNKAFSIWIRDLPPSLTPKKDRLIFYESIAFSKVPWSFLQRASFWCLSFVCVAPESCAWDASWRNNSWRWEASSESVQTIRLLKVEKYPN